MKRKALSNCKVGVAILRWGRLRVGKGKGYFFKFGHVKFELLLVNPEDLLNGKLDVPSGFQQRSLGRRLRYGSSQPLNGT